MGIEDRIRAVVEPVVAELELELVDLVYGGGRLRITLDHPEGLTSGRLTKATRMISVDLDEADPISGHYTLEVSTPGVERTLRTPKHYMRSIGEQVLLKLAPNEQSIRRVRGELLSADDQGVTVQSDDETHAVSYTQISKAKTVFDWGPTPKPGSQKKKKQSGTTSPATTKG